MNELRIVPMDGTRRRMMNRHQGLPEQGRLFHPLSEKEMQLNALFEKRIVCIKPSGSTGILVPKTARPELQPDGTRDGMLELDPRAARLLSKAIGGALTPESIRQWLSAHAEDWDGIILREVRNITNTGPATCDEVLKLFETRFGKKSELLGLSAPARTALERVIGGCPSSSRIMNWIATHKNSWERSLYDTKRLHAKTVAELSEFLVARGCKRCHGSSHLDAQPRLTARARNLLGMVSGIPNPTVADLRRWADDGGLKTLEEMAAFFRQIGTEAARTTGK